MIGPTPEPERSQNPLFEMSGLIKEYHGRRVLDIDALIVQRGEVLGMVGPSGSGKSTLLRLMNFLEPPTHGKVIFEGLQFSSEKDMPLQYRRRVTTVFQRPMLLDRTVWDNVSFGLRLRGRRDGDDRVRSVLEEVGLSHLARQRARTLSGGEAQRVALARAMVLDPVALLLDEPTANLDPFNVDLIEAIIRRLNEERRTTLVLVTHNVFQAHRLADRAVFLLDGKIVEIAPTEEFFQSPRDPRTSAFVRGEMIY